MMTRVAAVALVLAMYRGCSWLCNVAAITTFLPAFAWSNTGGKIWWNGGQTWWKDQPRPRGTIDERLDLFARAWFWSTVGMISLIELVAMAQGISLGNR